MARNETLLGAWCTRTGMCGKGFVISGRHYVGDATCVHKGRGSDTLDLQAGPQEVSIQPGLDSGRARRRKRFRTLPSDSVRAAGASPGGVTTMSAWGITGCRGAETGCGAATGVGAAWAASGGIWIWTGPKVTCTGAEVGGAGVGGASGWTDRLWSPSTLLTPRRPVGLPAPVGEGRTGWLRSGGTGARRAGRAITHSGDCRLGALGRDVAGLATTKTGRGARALLIAVAVAITS